MIRRAQSDIFISYNQHDRGWAEWIAEELKAEGLTVKWQGSDMPVGSHFPTEIHEAIRESECLLAVLSPDYLNAEWSRREALSFVNADVSGKGRRVLGVRVRKCEPDGLLMGIAYEDIVGLGRTVARQRLLTMVRHRFGKKKRSAHSGGKRRSFPTIEFPDFFLPPPIVPEVFQAFHTPQFKVPAGISTIPEIVKNWTQSDVPERLILVGVSQRVRY